MLIFDIEQMESRFAGFLDFFLRERREACNDFAALQNACAGLEREEALFLAFLDTHFHSVNTAQEFYRKLNWTGLSQCKDTDNLPAVCQQFFKTEHKIGDHRRYFRCKSYESKVSYTIEVLQSYTKVLGSESQAAFFEFGGRPKFDDVYQKMSNIYSFKNRLPRFDHLERLTRVLNWSATPERFYAEEASGPLSGLTYLVIGKRYGKNKRVIRQYLKTNFLVEWNAQVGSQFAIQSSASFSEVIQRLEQWLIQRVKQELPDHAKQDTFVFDLETCLCNWQKRKQ